MAAPAATTRPDEVRSSPATSVSRIANGMRRLRGISIETGGKQIWIANAAYALDGCQNCEPSSGRRGAVPQRMLMVSPDPKRLLTPANATVVTCHLNYQIDPAKVREFEHYARLWIELVTRFGGTHHGYFLPHEGASDLAVALFSFPSLAAYEIYRTRIADDADSQAAFAFAAETRCIIRYDRSFLRPVLA